MLLVSSSIDELGAVSTGAFVGVERGRGGRTRFAGGGDEQGDDVPFTTAAIVSEMARRKSDLRDDQNETNPYNHVSVCCRQVLWPQLEDCPRQ